MERQVQVSKRYKQAENVEFVDVILVCEFFQKGRVTCPCRNEWLFLRFD